MKLTRERKVYGLLLAVGCVALVGDRLLGGPSAAMATATPDQDGATTQTTPVAPTPKATRVAIGEQLSTIMASSFEGDGRDAFQIDASWRAMLEPLQESDSGATPAKEARVESVLPGVTLPKVTMVMQNGASGCAMIDGKLVQVGSQTASGATLLGIDQRAARLLVNGVEVEVPVVDSGSAEGR